MRWGASTTLAGFFHGDIRPSNLLASSEGKVLIIDADCAVHMYTQPANLELDLRVIEDILEE